jgi:hypothetical protein
MGKHPNRNLREENTLYRDVLITEDEASETYNISVRDFLIFVLRNPILRQHTVTIKTKDGLKTGYDKQIVASLMQRISE